MEDIFFAILKSCSWTDFLSWIELIKISFKFIFEFRKRGKSVRVSNPPVKSKEILSVCFLRERIIYPHLSTHLSIISKLSSEPKGIEFSL